jgi:high-affinity nickel permease
MIGFLSILAVGFFLGMRHATDPDHVIAVSTIVTREQKLSRAALIGVFWGIGHTLTILAVGIAIILFGLVIPPHIGLSMELSVGLMLILLGLMNVYSFFRGVAVNTHEGEKALIHSHAHSHGEYIHTHAHSHAPDRHPHSPDQTPLARVDHWLGKLSIYQQIRPLVVGIVHGLAGSAAVALLVLTAIRSPRWAVAYLLLFGFGTIAGMMLITMSMASAFHLMGAGRQRFSRQLSIASGLVSLIFGLVVVYQICITNGLITGTLHWTPR